MRRLSTVLLLLSCLAFALPASAADAAAIDGAKLGFAWAIPFAGMLLSIALLPLLGFVGNGKTMYDLPQLARHVREAYEELTVASSRKRKASGRAKR